MRHGIRQLRADTHEVASDRRVNRTGGLDSDVHAFRPESLGKGRHFRNDHRFPPGYDDVAATVTADRLEHFSGRKCVAFRMPGRVRRIAPGTPQIASGGAHKDGRYPEERTFALHRIKNLRNLHAVEGASATGSTT